MAEEKKAVSRAIGKYLRIAPRKARVIADLVRDKGVEEALAILRFKRRSGTRELRKIIESAVANAGQSKEKLDVDKLYVSRVFVDAGPTLRRFLPRAMGRATRIRKRSSHVTVEIDVR